MIWNRFKCWWFGCGTNRYSYIERGKWGVRCERCKKVWAWKFTSGPS